MDSVKFKAWDKDRNKMIQVCGMHWSISVDGEPQRVCALFDRIWTRNFELRQFIGRKDSKGIDLYKGDVISISTLPRIKFEIVYDAHSASWIARNGRGRFIALPSSEFIEVIGNIYENSELIEARNELH